MTKVKKLKARLLKLNKRKLMNKQYCCVTLETLKFDV